MIRRRVAIAALAILAAVALWTAAHEVDRLDTYHPRAVPAAPARPPAGPAQAKRVVWVIVDGLRADTASRQPGLARLASSGSWIPARSELPSYSVPNYVAMATGAEPAVTGVRTNDYAGPVPLPTIASVLGPSRVATAGNDSDWLGWLFGEETVLAIDEAHFLDGARRALALDRALVVFHVSWPDEAAHQHGAASPEYEAAAHRADELLTEWARALDPTRDALLVTSDHGHVDRGGHGGDEPEVLETFFLIWGAGAHALSTAAAGARNRDVAATISALLGIDAPPGSRGRDAPDVPEEEPNPLALALLALAIAGLALMLYRAAARTPQPTWSLGLAALLALIPYALFFARHRLSLSSADSELGFTAETIVRGLAPWAIPLAFGGRLGLSQDSLSQLWIGATAVSATPVVYSIYRAGLWAPIDALPPAWLHLFPTLAWATFAIFAINAAAVLAWPRGRSAA